jgi:hypothetical protein
MNMTYFGHCQFYEFFRNTGFRQVDISGISYYVSPYTTNANALTFGLTNIVLRSAFFWDINSVYCGNFLLLFRDILSVPSSTEHATAGSTKTSARNCHYTLSNIPKERRFHLLRGGSLNSCSIFLSTETAIALIVYTCC